MTEPDYLAIIKQRGSGALDKKMGIEITEASLTRLVATMPVEGNTQPMGILHGGANVVLAESLGSIGKTLCCWDIVITNENGQRTCTARITCMILADR